MFQLLSRNFAPVFKARSAARDAKTDRSRATAILQAIEQALALAELEQAGLGRRVEEVMARAAVTLGNGPDEYLDREALDSRHHDLFDVELTNGQRRLNQLDQMIPQYKALQAEAIRCLGFPASPADDDAPTDAAVTHLSPTG